MFLINFSHFQILSYFLSFIFTLLTAQSLMHFPAFPDTAFLRLFYSRHHRRSPGPHAGENPGPKIDCFAAFSSTTSMPHSFTLQLLLSNHFLRLDSSSSLFLHLMPGHYTIVHFGTTQIHTLRTQLGF